MKPQGSTKPSRVETGISITILAVLCIIGIRTFSIHFQYSPAVLLTESTAASAAKQQQTGTETITALFKLPQGIQPFTPPERFNPQTLSDKIDGKAELYLSAGFRELNSQRFNFTEGATGWMEVFVYDMASAQNAFAVFSAQRRDDAIALDMAPYAYRTSNALFLTHGPFYLEVIGAEASPEIWSAMRAIGEAFIQQTSVRTEVMSETDLFPSTALIRDSITLIASDAFGYDQFDRVFVAEYQVDGNRLVAFLSKRKTPQEAQRLAKGYSDFLMTYGGSNVSQEGGNPAFRVIQILGSHEIIFSHGRFLAGIHEAADPRQGIELANRLHRRLKDINQ